MNAQIFLEPWLSCDSSTSKAGLTSNTAISAVFHSENTYVDRTGIIDIFTNVKKDILLYLQYNEELFVLSISCSLFSVTKSMFWNVLTTRGPCFFFNCSLAAVNCNNFLRYHSRLFRVFFCTVQCTRTECTNYILEKENKKIENKEVTMWENFRRFYTVGFFLTTGYVF